MHEKERHNKVMEGKPDGIGSGTLGTEHTDIAYKPFLPIGHGWCGGDAYDRMTDGSTLEFRISDPEVSPEFWDALDQLWEIDPMKSPIQSPAILRHHSNYISHRTVVILGYRLGRPVAAVVLQLQNDGGATFLSDLKTDVNHFLFDPTVTGTEKDFFFRSIVRAIKANNWSWTLNNQPAWVDHLEQLERIAREEGLYCSSVPHSACPVVEATTPQELFKYVNGFRELRYRVNRLRKRDDVEFEILIDDRDLEGWVAEFCDVHVLRWADTPTPSHFLDTDLRVFYLGCLKAWSEAGLLVRFAIKVAGQRIGFVVGLRAGDVLIHHNTTYHPDHSRSSPGKALIHIMAEWMSKNGFRILDFGNGREEYKYSVATGENQLKRIFMSRRSNIRFRVSAEVIQGVYKMPRAYSFYQNQIKRRLRSR